MAGLWASPNKTASCSLVWRNLSSEALSGLVMSRRHIIKRNICAAQRGSSAHFLITPPTLNMHENPKGCVYVFSWRTRWWWQIWHQLNRPTTVTVLKQTVCLNGNCQLNLFYSLRCCWDLLMCLLRNFPGGKYIYMEGNIDLLLRDETVHYSIYVPYLITNTAGAQYWNYAWYWTDLIGWWSFIDYKWISMCFC